MQLHFFSALILAGTAVSFVFISLVISKLLRPSAPSKEKAMVYECGEEPIGQAWINFNPRFAIVALIFIVFEVEIALIFPVASVYSSFIVRGRGGAAFIEIFGFIAVLAAGLAWVWARGDLDWIKSLREDLSSENGDSATSPR